MTNLLYYPGNEYQKEFDSEVAEVNEVDGYICFEETLFYPEGGSQPADRGNLSWENGGAAVTDVQKENGEVRHFVDGDFPDEGVEVHGEIDWERRFKHMRMHTAQHVMSWIVLNMYDAETYSLQIGADKTRLDFKPADFNEKDVEKIEKGVNSLIEKELEVDKKEVPRDELEEQVQKGRTKLDIIPDHIDPLRAIVIGGEDICPCSGTHIDNLEEIGGIKIINHKSQGSDKERLEFTLL